MSVRTLARKLDTAAIFALQSQQYSEKLLMTVTVAAGQTALGRTAVSNLGHFLCQTITGHFETLVLGGVGPAPIDDGVCHLRALLRDSSGNRALFSDYIPVDLLLSPGRRRSNTANNVVAPFGVVAVAPPPFPLFYPGELEYLFAANSEILLDVRNDSDVPQTVEVCFHGIRILSRAAVAGVR